MEKEKVFFKAGDRVRIKQEIPCPIMVVKHVNKAISTEHDNKNFLVGVSCFWFTTENAYQSQLFSTKDLVHI